MGYKLFNVDLIDTDLFMQDLVILSDLEKRYKAGLKKGYTVLTLINESILVNSDKPLTEEEIKEMAPKNSPAHAHGRVRVFGALNQFSF